MGGTGSRYRHCDGMQQRLLYQFEELCATEEKNMLDYTIQLRLFNIRLPTLTITDFKVTDINTGEVHFQIEKDPSKKNWPRWILRDGKGQPVLYLQQLSSSELYSFKMYSGSDPSKEICQVGKLLRDRVIKSCELKVHFKDVLKGDPGIVVFGGFWDKKKCYIYNGEIEKGGKGVACTRPIGKNNVEKEYILQVGPGIDIALLVTICLARDILN